MLENIKDKENLCGTKYESEYESDEDDESLWKAETNHTYETLLYLLKEARKFALVEDVTYLDTVHNLITNTQKIVYNKNYQEIAINQILIIS